MTAKADTYRIIDSFEDAAQARVDLIRGAKSSILISYFIYRNDDVGLTMMSLLREAARRGVKVKILVDGSFHNISKNIISHLIAEGVEVKEFHPKPRLFPGLKNINPKKFFKKIARLTRRMHDKMIIVDGEKLLTGGRNIKKSYFGLDDKNYRDRDVLVISPSVSNAFNYFENLWVSKHTGDFHKLKRMKDKHRKKGQKILDEAYQKTYKYELISMSDPSSRDWSSGEKDVKKIEFLSDGVLDGKFTLDPSNLGTKLYQMAKGIKKTLNLESPYLVPTKRFYRLLRELVAKGVEVNITTNSVCSTDGKEVTAAYSNQRKKLVRMGVNVYEYKGPDYLHAKSAVFDHQKSLIGSYNMDPRSAHLNTEVAVTIDDRDISAKLEDSFLINRNNSSKLYLDKSGKLQGKFKDCKRSAWKVFYTGLMRLVTRIPFIYNQL